MTALKLRRVRIFSNKTAKDAERLINENLEAFRDNENIEINYELEIENSTQMGSFYDTRYTVVIHEFDVNHVDEYGME